MKFHSDLAYGSQTIPFETARPPDVWNIVEPEPAIGADLFRQRLECFLSQHRLDLRRPAVVVGDKTRLCGYPEFLPVLFDALAAAGMADTGPDVYIAYGTHARQSDAESRRAYGPAYATGRWHHHRCDRPDAFIELGRTAHTPVRLLKALLEASCIISFGAVSHHYFAGYGGGRKLIFPGLGEREAIYANHGLFLDRRLGRLSAGCRPGVIAGNPLAEDLAQIETFRPADLAIHGSLDSRGQVCDLLVGRGPFHFETACARHGSHCEVEGAAYDLVVASCGGFPKDLNFIQSHKAIENAAAFVRDEGRLIVLAQCRDGIGSDTFLPWFELGGWQAAFDRLAQAYAGNGGTALSLMTKTRRIRIALVTDLPADTVKMIGLEHWTIARAQHEINRRREPFALLPNASMLVRRSGLSATPDQMLLA